MVSFELYRFLFSRPPGVAGIRLSVFVQYFFSLLVGQFRS